MQAYFRLSKDWRADILAEIEEMCGLLGWSETYFGKVAMNNPYFTSRIREGGSITIDTLIDYVAWKQSEDMQKLFKQKEAERENVGS
jgi:hypothetical protein